MMQKTNDENNPSALFEQIRGLIHETRQKVAVSVNAELTLLYWNIGKQIKQEILNDSRAEYGKKVVSGLSKQLTLEFGSGWGRSQLNYCLQMAEVFPDIQIVHTLCGQFSWSHFRIFFSIENELKRTFYMEMAKMERWSVRELDNKIDSMLYERTAISRQSEDLIKQELNLVQSNNVLNPDLIFRDTYVLDFLGLSGHYAESDLEKAILANIQAFILEFGTGFAFIESQKRISIDATDYYLDLLFYHRKLRRLIAIDLKMGKFKPQYKGQMELYLRWLERYEMQEGEQAPIGLLLCSEGNTEHIELLMLNQSDIRVAQYLTELPSKEWFIQKLQKAIELVRTHNLIHGVGVIEGRDQQH